MVREVVAEVGGGAVATSRARGRAGRRSRSLRSHVGAVLLVRRAPRRASVVEHRGDLAALVQRALREPRVEVHADAPEVVLESVRRRRGSPTRGPAPSVTSSPSSARMRVGHLDEVLALVAVLGRLLAAVAREAATRRRCRAGCRRR